VTASRARRRGDHLLENLLENLKLLLLPLLLLLSTMAAADAWRPAASNLCRSMKGRDARLRDGVTLGPIRCHA